MKNLTLALALACVPLSAQPLQASVDSTFAVEMKPESAVSTPKYRSPGKAALISLGSMVLLTGVGSAILVLEERQGAYTAPSKMDRALLGTGGTLLFSGIFLAPSAGQIYLGDYGHATTATLFRLAGVGLMAAGTCILCEEGDNTPLIFLGLGLFTYGMVYSFVQPYKSHPRPVRQAPKNAQVELFPTVARRSDGTLLPGLAARVKF